jgi:hypothetical protein
MTAHRDDALTDARLAQEIEQALAVDPSPEFVARVRTHIASAPSVRRWSMRWPLVALGRMVAAIVLIVTAAMMSGVFRSRRVVAPEPPAVVRTEPPVAPPSVTPLVRGTEPRPRIAAPMTVRHDVRPSTEPEVLIPKGEAEALRRLMRGLHTGAVDPATFAQGSRASAVVQPTADIVLQPLAPLTPVTLEPLASMTRQEGVRQ